jgi:hypothetical protein
MVLCPLHSSGLLLHGSALEVLYPESPPLVSGPQLCGMGGSRHPGLSTKSQTQQIRVWSAALPDVHELPMVEYTYTSHRQSQQNLTLQRAQKFMRQDDRWIREHLIAMIRDEKCPSGLVEGCRSTNIIVLEECRKCCNGYHCSMLLLP